jgi:hypothetical protein
VAVAYASAPEAEAVRSEIVLTLLDLTGRSPAVRLGAARDLLARAMALAAALGPAPAAAPADGPRRRGRGRNEAPVQDPAAAGGPGDAEPGGDTAAPEGGSAKASAAERRRALALLLDLWRDLARDLAFVQAGASPSVRDVARLEDIEAVARRLRPGAAVQALARLVRAGELLDVNASPELLLDVLLVRWPHPASAA